MSSNSTNLVVGGILTVLTSVVILYVSTQGEPIVPGIVGSVAALVMALGVLLVGTSSKEGRPV